MNARILIGDCRQRMAEMEENSIDAIVTDPPYGLEFMGKEWDKFKDTSEVGQGWNEGADWKGIVRKRPGRLYLRSSHYTCQKCRKQKHAHDDAACPVADYIRETHEPRQMRAFQRWAEAWAVEALRVAKPGAHLLAFGGTRTHHRLMCAIEDAGWEIRDCLSWLYGSGFPKSLDVSKAIDRARMEDNQTIQYVTARLRDALAVSGRTRAEIDAHFGTVNVSQYWFSPDRNPQIPPIDKWPWLRNFLSIGSDLDAEVWRLNGRKGQPGDAYQSAQVISEREALDIRNGHGRPIGGAMFAGSDTGNITLQVKAANSDAARQWSGWGTALKPSYEPIILARKPLQGTVAANVQKHGTGALNIDGCRIAGEVPQVVQGLSSTPSSWEPRTERGLSNPNTLGRWPANVCLDETAAAMLDQQSGERTSAGGRGPGPILRREMTSRGLPGGGLGQGGNGPELRAPSGFTHSFGDSGGASRFFYTAKAGQDERWLALKCHCQTRIIESWQRPLDRNRDARTDSTLREKATSERSSTGGLGSDTSSLGRPPTGQFRQDTKSITSTAENKTIGSTTSGSSRLQNTSDFTADASYEMASGGNRAASVKPSSRSTTSTGIAAGKAGHSTVAVNPATSPESSQTSDFGSCVECGGSFEIVGHPTCKPESLMRWLCRLVTQPGGVILDPFCGSGSTGVAALGEQFNFIGIEQDPTYAAIAERRIANVAPLLAQVETEKTEEKPDPQMEMEL